MHVELGGYHVRDVEVVAAFDVDGEKVGRDVAEAIPSRANNTIRFAETCRRRASPSTAVGRSTGSGPTTAT